MRRTLPLIVFALLVLLAAYVVFFWKAPVSYRSNRQREAVLSVSTSTKAATDARFTEILAYPHFGNAAIDSRVEALIATTTLEFEAEARADTSGQEMPYDLESTFDHVYSAPDVLSVRLLIERYTGGAHPNTTAIGLNFNPQTGAPLSLDDALALIGMNIKELARKSLQQLTAPQSETATLVQFKEGADPKPENYSAFTINKQSVTFYFQQYQVAPYVAGILSVTFARVK